MFSFSPLLTFPPPSPPPLPIHSFSVSVLKRIGLPWVSTKQNISQSR